MPTKKPLPSAALRKQIAVLDHRIARLQEERHELALTADRMDQASPWLIDRVAATAADLVERRLRTARRKPR